MRIPVIKGRIKRRLLVNFRAAPEVVQRIVPDPFRPKLYDGHAIVGVCLIRLEQIRPAGLPSFLGNQRKTSKPEPSPRWRSNKSSAGNE